MSRVDTFYIGLIISRVGFSITLSLHRKISMTVSINIKAHLNDILHGWLDGKDIKLSKDNRISRKSYRKLIELLWPWKMFMANEKEKAMEQVLWILDNPAPRRSYEGYVVWLEAIDDIGEAPPFRDQKDVVVNPSFKYRLGVIP